MRASDLLIDGGIIPRWQCFIYEENKDEIVHIYRIAKQIKESRCPELEFFVHEGSCDGENRKLYPIRIQKDHIPAELASVFLDYDELMTESECCELLREDDSPPAFSVEDEITLNISNEYNVFYNFTHMTKPWEIGNLKTDAPETLVNNIISGNTPALNAAKRCKWSELVTKYGDFSSGRVFSLDDYKMFLFNKYLEYNQ